MRDLPSITVADIVSNLRVATKSKRETEKGRQRESERGRERERERGKERVRGGERVRGRERDHTNKDNKGHTKSSHWYLHWLNKYYKKYCGYMCMGIEA